MGGTIGSSSLKRVTRISGSRWRQERAQLIEMGLMSFAERREIREDGVRRVKYYSLTKKGIEVAKHVQEMGHLLVRDHFPEIRKPLAKIIK